jgi:hypothetical protein
MGQTVLIPAWVAPSARAVADCHWIAAAHNPQVRAVMDWVTDGDTTEPNALALLGASHGDAQNTIAWLLGMSRTPPIELPRRNPDHTVVTADQLYAEYMAGKTGLPEQRNEARQRATTDAARYRRLAALVPH